MTSPTQPLFLVLEGLDGTGTTTVAALVAEALKGRDQRVCLTAEPTEGTFGRLLRRHVGGEVTLDPTTAALAFSADRSDHLDQVIRPALARGQWVISDRYLLSTLAYQGAEGVDPRTVLAASRGFEIPSLTVVLEAPDRLRVQRMSARGKVDRYEDPSLAGELREWHRRAAHILREAGHRIEEIDATPPAEQVAAEVLALLGGLDAGA